jgi:hypothetical protein
VAADGGAPAQDFPASYKGVIGIMGSDDLSGGPTVTAGHGSLVTLAAPGVEILTTVPHGSYDFLPGSSVAAAQVSGIAALLLEKNPKLMRLGIVIRGKQRVPANLADEVKLASLDFSKFGSLNLIVAKFRGSVFPIDVFEDIKGLLDPRSIRPNAFLFLRKGPDGKVAGMEGSGLEDAADVTEFNVIVTAVTSRMIEENARMPTMRQAAQAAAEGDFGLSAEALRTVSDRLQPGESALVVFFENLWERRFREIAAKYDGEIVNQRLVTPRALVEAAQKLVAAAS